MPMEKEPFYVQLTSGESNKQCDIFPHNSIHQVIKNEHGMLQAIKRNVDFIPMEYPVKILDSLPELKQCIHCKNDFPIDTDFIKVDKDHSCIRCYERMHLPNRDEYRTILRKIFTTELSN